MYIDSRTLEEKYDVNKNNPLINPILGKPLGVTDSLLDPKRKAKMLETYVAAAREDERKKIANEVIDFLQKAKHDPSFIAKIKKLLGEPDPVEELAKEIANIDEKLCTGGISLGESYTAVAKYILDNYELKKK